MNRSSNNIDSNLNLRKSITSRFSDISNFRAFRVNSGNLKLNYVNIIFNSIVQYIHSNKLDITPESIKSVVNKYLIQIEDGKYHYEILRITIDEASYKLVNRKLLDYYTCYKAILSSEEVR